MFGGHEQGNRNCGCNNWIVDLVDCRPGGLSTWWIVDLVDSRPGSKSVIDK
jgi:hypothetical protein